MTALLSRQAFDLVLSPAIVAEVEAALGQAKIGKCLLEPGNAPLWLADILAIADLVPDTGRVAGACRDPGDDMVLAAAIEGRVGAIVTGDRDLLAMRDYDAVPIMTPRAFLDML